MGCHEPGGHKLKRLGSVCGGGGCISGTPLNRTVVAFFALTLCKSSPARSLDNLSLLTGTLMTHKKIGCPEKPISLHCPADTNVVIKSAKYSNFSLTAVEKSTAECDRDSGRLNPRLQSLENDEKCRWRDSLQTAVEACRSKQKCQFQISPSKFEIEACIEEAAFIEIDYNCRPASFSGKVGCEYEKINLECEPFMRLAIFAASYGRTQYQSVQCPQPQGVAEETCLLSYATEIVIDHCHGKRNCTLVADAKTFGNPCKEKSRVYLKVVYACVPKRVLSEKYEEPAGSDEGNKSGPSDRMFLGNVWDNDGESSSPNLTVDRISNETDRYGDVAVLLHRSTSDDARNSSSNGVGGKYYAMYLIGGIICTIILSVSFAVTRFIWKRRKINGKDKLHDVVVGKSLSHTFNDEISEVDADVILTEITTAAVTVVPTSSPRIFSSPYGHQPQLHDHHHHLQHHRHHTFHDHRYSYYVTGTDYIGRLSPDDTQNDVTTVVRYGKDGITPRSLCQDGDSQFYNG